MRSKFYFKTCVVSAATSLAIFSGPFVIYPSLKTAFIGTNIAIKSEIYSSEENAFCCFDEENRVVTKEDDQLFDVGGIDDLDMETSLIKGFANVDRKDYLLAFKYKIRLKEHAEKRGIVNNRAFYIKDYLVNFEFYFLDEYGFCLKQINTEKAQKQTSPYSSNFLVIDHNSTCGEQVIILDPIITKDMVARIKKIVYYPTFQIGFSSKINKEINYTTVKKHP
jgi:hypothetical protein